MVTIRSHQQPATHSCREPPELAEGLMQHHPDHRLARPTPPVRPPAFGAPDPARRLQRVLGPGVAALKPMLGLELLVEVLDREVEVARLEQLQNPRHLVYRRPPRRQPRQPRVGQAQGPRRLRSPPPAVKRTHRHPQQVSRFLARQPPRSVTAINILKPHLADLLKHACPTHPPLLSRNGSKIGQTSCYRTRSHYVLPTPKRNWTCPSGAGEV